MKNVAKQLAENPKKVGSVEYVWSNGGGRSPCLRLVPPSKKKPPKFQVNLHFGMHSIDWIPKLRLVPNRCNIKCKSVSMKTQRYNHSLMFDARHQFEDKHLHSIVGHANVEAALVLIQVWALQRGLWRNHDGWTKENVAMFLIYLLRTHKMNSRMTPIQLFTVVLQTWANTNWLGEEENKNENTTVRAAHSQTSQFHKNDKLRRSVLVLPLEDSSEKETIRQSELGRLYAQQTEESPLSDDDPPTLIEAYASPKSYFLGPVFLDPTLTYNFLGDVSPNYMKLLRSHAKKSLQGLKQPRTAFSFLFMRSVRFWNQWDLYVQVPMEKSAEWESSSRGLVETIELALGNRIRGLRVLSTGNGDASKGKAIPDDFPTRLVDKQVNSKQSISQSPTGTNKIVIGISVNPETSQRVVDRGPPSDKSKEVQSFMKLWGDKAELRRFKDGAIVQAVVWNEKNDGTFQNEGKLNGGYVEKIVKHIVQLHFTKAPIQFSLSTLLSVVDGAVSEKETSSPFADPITSHQDIMTAFDSLSDFLRNNSQPPGPGNMGTTSLGLPLPIDAVEPISPCLRYSELFPPVPHPFLGGRPANTKKVSGALVSDPILIQIRFGSSSKWPNDLKAIGAAKTAMLIQLADAIEASGREGFEGPVLVTPTYADVGFKGYCFRILVRADPEIRMLQGLVQPSPVASALLTELTRKHLVASKHHSTIHAVHSLHPSAGSVVRMAKRWLASHLLSGLIATEAIELLVAKVYSDDEALLEVPGTVQAGFLRFLHLLANHDWAR
jgi:U3 small nucleolar RNA-associated protein 22